MCTKYVFIITGPLASRLVCQAHSRLDAALCPRTASAYLTRFKLYLAFISWLQLPLQDLDSILAFLEFLTQNGSRAHALTSYISVLRHYFKCCDIDISALAHRKVYLIIKSVSINSTYIPKFKANITISMLDKITSKCDTLRYGCVYKAVFLLAYFVFLRLSNVVPVLAKSFDATRNLLRGDIIFGPPGLHYPQVEQVNAILQCPPSGSKTFPLPLPSVPCVCPQGPPGVCPSLPLLPPLCPSLSHWPCYPYFIHGLLHPHKNDQISWPQPSQLWFLCIQAFSSILGH